MSRHSHFEVITTDESGRWDDIIEEIGVFAFYHLSSFHRLAEMLGEGWAFMPVFRHGDCLIAFPLLERDIEIPGVIDAAEGLKDATSVRGFAGPVASDRHITEDIRQSFQQELQDYFRHSNIISVYARLNPLTTPISLLEGYGNTADVGVTVSLDLADPPDVQFDRYRKGHRYEIKRLKKLGFVCEEVGLEYITDFMRVYYDAMNRVKAGPEYYFNRAYIEYLLRDMSDVMHLFVCRQDGAIASVSIETYCKGILEGYIGGTSTEYLRLAPDKLVYDTVREWGNRIGARTYHLGGGVGAQRDSLYDFKMGFGGREHVYYTWRHVVDAGVYNDLNQRVMQAAGTTTGGSYFPVYRDSSLVEACSRVDAICNQGRA